MDTILLIEPHGDSARTYAESLQRAGFRVETAASTHETDRSVTPSVVVISVPNANQPLLRVFSQGRAVPRIVLSSDQGDARRAAELECAAVLIRPVMYDALVSEVRRVLKTAGAHQPS